MTDSDPATIDELWRLVGAFDRVGADPADYASNTEDDSRCDS